MALSTSGSVYNVDLTSERVFKMVLSDATFDAGSELAIPNLDGKTAVVISAWDNVNGATTGASINGDSVDIGVAGKGAFTALVAYRDV